MAAVGWECMSKGETEGKEQFETLEAVSHHPEARDIEMERELETAEDCDQGLRQMEAKTEQYIYFLSWLSWPDVGVFLF